MLTRRFSLAAIELIWVHGGILNGKAHTNLARVLFVIPHHHVSPPETVLGMSVARPDITSQPVTTSDGKEAFRCVRMDLILTHVHPAGCTSSDDMDAPTLHNEGGQLNEINVISFWWSPDVKASFLCILAFLLYEMLNQV